MEERDAKAAQALWAGRLSPAQSFLPRLRGAVRDAKSSTTYVLAEAAIREEPDNFRLPNICAI